VSYIELHTSSAFSFLRGASLPETLIERAAALGYPAIALLDRDGVYGLPRFYQAAKSAGIRAIVGAELTIVGGHGGAVRAADRTSDRQGLRRGHAATGRPFVTDPAGSLSLNSGAWTLPVLVESQDGWRNLCRLITRMKLRAAKGEGALTLEDLEGFTSGLVALPGRSLLLADRYGVGGLLDRLLGLFGRGNVYVELQRHLRRDQEDDNDTLVCLADAFRVPLVATGGVRFASPEDRPLHDVLTAIREHTTLDAAGRRLSANAERYLKPPAQMVRLFADHPDAVRASLALADRLQFTMNNLGYRFPRYPVPSGETEMSFLRKITEVGARDRYRPFHDRARAQIARELGSEELARLHREIPLLDAATVAGALAWATSSAAGALGAGPAVASATAAVVVGFCGESLTDRLCIPPLLVAVCGIVPLLPGLAIYRGLFAIVVESDLLDGVNTLVGAAAIGLGLAAGVALGEYFGRTLRGTRDRFDRRVSHRATISD